MTYVSNALQKNKGSYFLYIYAGEFTWHCSGVKYVENINNIIYDIYLKHSLSGNFRNSKLYDLIRLIPLYYVFYMSQEWNLRVNKLTIVTLNKLKSQF